MDETGIFYRMTPDRSLTTSDKTKGTKKLKERITVVLTYNADGSEKLRPLVIGRVNCHLRTVADGPEQQDETSTAPHPADPG